MLCVFLSASLPCRSLPNCHIVIPAITTRLIVEITFPFVNDLLCRAAVMPEAVGQQVPECRKQDSSNEHFLVRSLLLCVATRRYRLVL